MDRYFETMGIPIIAGRSPDDRDRATTAAVAVVNETLAKRQFPTLDLPEILGQPIKIGNVLGATLEVVGVAARVRSRRPDAPPDPEVYVPFEQNPAPSMTFVVRAQGDPAALSNHWLPVCAVNV